MQCSSSRCNLCQFTCKSSKWIKKHSESAHPDKDKSFSRYAVDSSAGPSLLLPPPRVNLDETLTSNECGYSTPSTSGFGNEDLDATQLYDLEKLKSDRKYKQPILCDYCHETVETVELLKEHHAFLHSHLPLQNLSSAKHDDGVGDGRSGKVQTLDLSSARHGGGTKSSTSRTPMSGMKPTARKSSTPRSSSRHGKHVRRIACKSTKKRRRASSPDNQSSQASVNISSDEEEEDEDLETRLKRVSALIHLSGAGPVMLGYAEIKTFFDIDPTVVLSDISQAFQEGS